MRLALLGTDPDALALLAAAVGTGHQIVWLGEVRPDEADAVGRLVPYVAPSVEWESLLDRALADAVIVGRGTAGDDLRAEQLKRLVTDAVTVLAVHPASRSVLTYYELDMTCRETGCTLRHYNPLPDDAALADLARWVREGHDVIGPVHQVTCERSLSDAGRRSVLDQLARDAELLRCVAGDIRTATAVGPRDVDGSYASLQVQMTIAGDTSLRWSVAPGSSQTDDGALTLVGRRGTATLRLPGDGATNDVWQLSTTVDGRGETQSLAPWNAAHTTIEGLAAAVAGRGSEFAAAASTWDSATQAMEVVDAVELSLQKGRTVDVHHQQLTEQLAFRGTMAALGCGLLTVALAVIVVVALLGGVESLLGQPLVRHWPLVLFGVLALFLLLQAVPLLVTRKK